MKYVSCVIAVAAALSFASAGFAATMSKSDMKMMKKCQGMSQSMMMKNKKCAALMKKEKMNGSGSMGSNSMGGGTMNNGGGSMSNSTGGMSK